jgi:hypothetical protein
MILDRLKIYFLDIFLNKLSVKILLEITMPLFVTQPIKQNIVRLGFL